MHRTGYECAVNKTRNISSGKGHENTYMRTSSQLLSKILYLTPSPHLSIYLQLGYALFIKKHYIHVF